MSSDSKNVTPPTTGNSSTNRRRRRMSRRKSSRRSNQYSEIATRLNNSAKRCLKQAGLTEERLEILALSDFKPMFSGQNKTLAGQMFDLRSVQRSSDIESVKITLQNLEEALPEKFSAAVLQYESAVTATETDIALLKIMILLREYATHTARLKSFIDEYSVEKLEEKIDVDFLGNSTFEMLESACGVSITGAAKENASNIFAQIATAINCSTSGLSPFYSSSGARLTTGSKFISRWRFNNRSGTSAAKDFAFDVAKIGRDLAFSREIVKIKYDLEPDEEFKQLIVDHLGESWITSPSQQNKTVISKFTGTSASTTSVYQKVDVNDITRLESSELLRYTKNTGLFDAIFFKSSKFGTLLPLESKSESYTRGSSTRNYEPIDKLVDDAFSGNPPLNFDRFNVAIDDVVDKTRNLANVTKKGFRILDESADGGDPRSFGFTANDSPLTGVSVAAVCLDVFNRRFASIAGPSLYSSFDSWLTPEHVAYTKLIAWLTIRDNPELCAKIVDRLLEDFRDGFLTAAGQPSPIEGTATQDKDGNEIAGTEELTAVQHVLPGTDTVVSLLGRSAGANTNNSRLKDYYNKNVRQMNPASVLSYSINENLETPKLRVNSDIKEWMVKKFFGDANPSDSDTHDLRLINCMSELRETKNRVRGGDTAGEFDVSTSNSYYGTKIVQAEIVDAFIEVLRILIEPFDAVEPVEEGDPVFPFIEGEIGSPYTNGPWNWSQAGYENFQFAYWVPTLLKFKEVFLRDSNTTYLYERDLFNRYGITSSIVGALSALMQPFDMLELRKETTSDPIRVSVSAGQQVWSTFTCLSIGLKDTADYVLSLQDAAVSYSPPGTFGGTGTSGVVAQQQANIPPEISSESALDELVGGLFDRGVNRDSCVQFFKNDLPFVAEDILGKTSLPIRSPSETDEIANIKRALIEMVNAAYQNDAAMIFLIDFIDKFADRVEGYRDAVLELVEGEGTALGELIENLREIGPAGEDVLQNITDNQLSLKQIALAEETGDAGNGYLPNLSILTSGEIQAVRALCNEPILKSPEGDTTKTVAVGIPAGAFEKADVTKEFCLRATYIDSEYPQLVFRPKSFKFDKDLYVLPEDLEITGRVRSFNDVLRKMKFSKLRVEVIESSDASPVITLKDDVTKVRYSQSSPDVYTNLAISEVLKIYYRVMVGVSFSETAFPSEPGGLDLQISDAAADLAASMAGNIEQIASFSEGLAGNVNDVLSDITKFSDPDSFVSGEITEVDESLLSGLKNAYQTRVFSPEVLRSRALSAKMFDRVYLLPVDPDEFYIVPPGQGTPLSEDGDSLGTETPQDVFDFYLNAGIIEETGLPSPRQYKLAPRKTAEGSMALGKVSVMMTTTTDAAERILEL